MDTQTLFGIIIGIVALLPGIWALFKEKETDEKDMRLRIEKAQAVGAITIELIQEMQERLSKLDIHTGQTEEKISSDKSKSRLYEKHSIIRCKYCRSANTVDSINCINCGAPIEGE
jgi:hypothetical protein